MMATRFALNRMASRARDHVVPLYLPRCDHRGRVHRVHGRLGAVDGVRAPVRVHGRLGAVDGVRAHDTLAFLFVLFCFCLFKLCGGGWS